VLEGVRVRYGPEDPVRALLADSRFLILDEPTAHLDPGIAGQVMRDIVAGAGERGLLVITHSTTGLEHFDEILELRAGRIAGWDRRLGQLRATERQFASRPPR
jgi:ABC-type transport system involved in cytochrome bd biosynthesis fused ATPase/permease subunit